MRAMRLKQWMIAVIGVLALAPLSFVQARAQELTRDQGRLQSSDAVLAEALHVPEGIPHDLLDKAHCVISNS